MWQDNISPATQIRQSLALYITCPVQVIFWENDFQNPLEKWGLKIVMVYSTIFSGCHTLWESKYVKIADWMMDSDTFKNTDGRM